MLAIDLACYDLLIQDEAEMGKLEQKYEETKLKVITDRLDAILKGMSVLARR